MYFTDFASLVEIDIFFNGLLGFGLSILRSLQGKPAASVNSERHEVQEIFGKPHQ